MAEYAIIESGAVVNVIVADEGWPTGINITALDPKPGIGWTFAGGVFAAPPAEPAQAPEPPITHTPRMTHFAFLRRLTLAEHIGIETATATDVTLRVAKQRFDAARDINVSFAETQQLVGYMAQQGLLAPARVPQLLALIALTEEGAINPSTGEVTGDRT